MKIIIVIAFVLISGCTRVDANPEPEHLSGVIKRYERIVDQEYGIVCHAEIYGRSISCVKVDEK